MVGHFGFLMQYKHLTLNCSRMRQEASVSGHFVRVTSVLLVGRNLGSHGDLLGFSVVGTISNFSCSSDLGVVSAINQLSASSPPVVRLLQQLVLKCLFLNSWVVARHVAGVSNDIANVFSCSQFLERFWSLNTRGGRGRGGVPRTSLGTARRAVEQLIRSSFALGTWSAYSQV